MLRHSAYTMAFLASVAAGPAHAADPLAQCKDFFAKFDKCIQHLEGDEKEEARVFVNTLRGTIGMSDDLNRGDANITGMMCALTMEEAKKDPDVLKYKCAW